MASSIVVCPNVQTSKKIIITKLVVVVIVEKVSSLSIFIHFVIVNDVLPFNLKAANNLLYDSILLVDFLCIVSFSGSGSSGFQFQGLIGHLSRPVVVVGG